MGVLTHTIELSEVISAIEALRHDVLGGEWEGLEPMAEQEFLLALAALEMAQRHFSLSRLHQARFIGERG